MDDARTRQLTLVACILGSAIVFVDQTVVNVALPALRRDLGGSLAGQQWVVEAYLLTLGALLLVGGSLGDLLGRRRVFELGLAGFGVTSLLCAVAPSGELLIVARGLQGIAGAMLVPSSLAVITEVYEEPERGKAIGLWTAWTGVSFIIGPLGGGLLVDFASWRWIFAINVPLVVLNLWLVRRHLPESLDVCPGARIDWTGAALIALGLGGLVYGLIERTAIAIAVGAVLVVAFVVWEARSARPMLPLSLFRERNFAAGNAATLLIYGGLGAVSFFVTIYLQQVVGYSATAAGLALLPVTILMLLGSGKAGELAAKLGPRRFMAAGPLVAAVGTVLMVSPEGGYLLNVLPGVMVFGAGLALTVAPLTSTVLNAAPPGRSGVASGANNAISRVASLVAIAGVGAVVAAVFESSAPAGTDAAPLSDGSAAIIDASAQAFQAGMLVSAALLAIGGLISLAGIRTPQRS